MSAYYDRMYNSLSNDVRLFLVARIDSKFDRSAQFLALHAVDHELSSQLQQYVVCLEYEGVKSAVEVA
jgi:hypothetical protein